MKTTFDRLIYLKLGGSLVTDKDKECTPRIPTIRRLAAEISQFHNTSPRTAILVGHGAGSYGHVQAVRNNLQLRGHNAVSWPGVLEVAKAISQLNRIIHEELLHVGLQTSAYHPSATAVCHNGHLRTLDATSIRHSLDRNIIPLIHGDICFDEIRGASIVSTETIFVYLSKAFTPATIYIAGVDEGVYTTYPDGDIIPVISNSSNTTLFNDITESRSPDVTGGMKSKVQEMLNLINHYPKVTVHIFSATQPESLIDTLNGKPTNGTVISDNHTYS